MRPAAQPLELHWGHRPAGLKLRVAGRLDGESSDVEKAAQLTAYHGDAVRHAARVL
jgi:hypothetical protein